MHNILFLSGGSLVGQNVLSALSGRRDSLYLIAMNSQVDEPALYDYDAVYWSPPINESPELFNCRFEEILALTTPDLIIPCRDDDVLFLASLLVARPESKGKILCGPQAIAASMLDKALSFTFSQNLGIPFAPAIPTDAPWSLVQSFIAEYGFPIIAKPRKGFASGGVRILFSANQAAPLKGNKDYILQQYIGHPKPIETEFEKFRTEGVPLFYSFEETKISIQGCISPEASVDAVFITKHLMKNGKSVRVEKLPHTSYDNLALEWCKKIAAAGWCGPLNIQCQVDRHGNLAIYEYNGRFTGATAARGLLGYDEVGIIFQSWLGIKLAQPNNPANNEYVVKASVNRVVDGNLLNALNEHKYWKNPNR